MIEPASNMGTAIAAVILGLLVTAADAQEGAGGVYKCTDEKGAVTYSSSPCKGAKREFLSKERLERKTMTVEFPKPAGAAAEVPAPPGEPPAKPAAVPAPATAPRAESSAQNTADNVVAPATLPAKPKIRRLPIETRKKD